MGPLPKRCHSCKASDHLIADCPKAAAQSKETTVNNKFTKTQRKKSERQRFRSKSKTGESGVDGEQQQSSTVVQPNQNGDEVNVKQEKD